MGRCWMLLEGNKTRPAEAFRSAGAWKLLATCLLLPPDRAQRRGQRPKHRPWHYLAPGALCERGGHTDWLTDWLTAHSAFQRAATYLCHGLFERKKNAFTLCRALSWLSPCDLRDNGADWEGFLFCRHFILLSSSISTKATDIKQSGALRDTSLFFRRNESEYRRERMRPSSRGLDGKKTRKRGKSVWAVRAVLTWRWTKADWSGVLLFFFSSQPSRWYLGPDKGSLFPHFFFFFEHMLCDRWKVIERSGQKLSSPWLLCNYGLDVRTRNQLGNPWQFLHSEHMGRQPVILHVPFVTDASTSRLQHVWPYCTRAQHRIVHNVSRVV